MAFKTTALRYLGGISGQGVVKQNGKTIAPAKFDLDGYYRPAVGVTGSGEIELSGNVLQGLFGRTDLELLTDQGLLLALRFSGSAPPVGGDIAHVEVTSQSPTALGDWRQ
jgi:hypothetical protein